MMIKKKTALVLAAIMTLSMAACSMPSASSEGAGANGSDASQNSEAAAGAGSAQSSQDAGAGSGDGSNGTSGTYGTLFGTVSNTIAEDEEALVSEYAGKFQQLTYSDAESGLSITYNLYLPEAYDASGSYPMVVFIADSSCVGDDATASLKQGKGALVWAAEGWQAVNPTIVAVPTYPETILDDHSGYTTTEYVELTKRFIDYMSSEYAVDTDRIYGTGQSMGCMTTLILASEYPDLYAACMFVDGQWDVSALKGLENQTFVYFAAEDDTSAWTGAQEVMAMFDTDSVDYKYAQWDGTWSADELSKAAQELFSDGTSRYFISWKTGTVDASTGSMGGFDGNMRGNGGFGGRGGMMGGDGSFTPPEGFGSAPDDFTLPEGSGNAQESFTPPEGITPPEGSDNASEGSGNASDGTTGDSSLRGNKGKGFGGRRGMMNGSDGFTMPDGTSSASVNPAKPDADGNSAIPGGTTFMDGSTAKSAGMVVMDGNFEIPVETDMTEDSEVMPVGMMSADSSIAPAEGAGDMGNSKDGLFIVPNDGDGTGSQNAENGMNGFGGQGRAGGMGGSGGMGGFGGSGGAGGMGSVAYHMASFDYAYNCIAVMEWLFQQK